MNWNQLITLKRLNKPEQTSGNPDIDRTQFQRDYDRIIFSSPFRRLQNKTQVFPLPGSIFVHNRLTHSLEVASVGRSLGTMLSIHLKNDPQYRDNVLLGEIGNIVATACLAHDLGNPSFGHSGEKAISYYFAEGEGKKYLKDLTLEEIADVTNFEGNANALRILTHNFNGREESPFSLTYSTIAALIKYPCESTASGDKTRIYKKKYGFFQSEKETYLEIARELGIIRKEDAPIAYYRHPLSFLVEAADDICYKIIDLEDAHRLKIFNAKEISDLLMPLLGGDLEVQKARLDKIQDANDKVSLLRAKAISNLIMAFNEAFIQNHDRIMNGTLNVPLSDCLDEGLRKQLDFIDKISVEKVYNYRSVVEKEIAGYQTINGLLGAFVPAMLSEKPSHYDKKLLQLIPNQYQPMTNDTYTKIQSVLDFISGMTDLYAIELFRKIRGISFPEL